MPMGPGKYDDICTMARRQAGISDTGLGAAIVIIIGGNLGSGFSCQADPATTLALPDMLENVAREMRKAMGKS